MWKVKWWRVVVALAAFFAVSYLLAATASYFLPWYLARKLSRDSLNLGIVPTPPPDKSVAKLEGPRFEQFEFSFQVPWQEVEQQKTSKMISVLSFKKGATLLVMNPSVALDNKRIVQGAETEGQDANAIRGVLGILALSSNYDLLAAELEATPAHVKWWATPRENTRSMVLLGLKSMEANEANAIYKASNDEMHGFQIGNPAVAPFRVRLVLFDRNDRRYEVWINVHEGRVPVLSQAEVNGIVASIRPIPHS
jgi:hypothetical protein